MVVWEGRLYTILIQSLIFDQLLTSLTVYEDKLNISFPKDIINCHGKDTYMTKYWDRSARANCDDPDQTAP